MFLTFLMLAVALCLSAIAAFYSIIGLTAIFASAVIPVAIMGSILEIAKLTVTVWLHEYWRQVKWTMRAYLVPAVGILMLITSMGIFGFLSKAHLDQAVPAGDISAQVSIFDEKIRTQRDNIEAARAALRQMDAAVDQTMSRSSDEKGADRAVQLRRQQAAERGRLQNDISRAQTEITRLQEQRAPIAAQARKVEAEVGPIKYIAALIYGDNHDQNLLEKAVRWVIIILVLVFDPLAIFMLLAATESWRWEKSRRQVDFSEQDEPKHASGLVAAIQTWHERVNKWRKTDANVDDDAAHADSDVRSSDGSLAVQQPVATVAPTNTKETLTEESDKDDEDNESQVIKQAKTLWKHDNPNHTLKEQRRLFEAGFINKLPWEDYYDDPRIVRDVGFGDEFPIAPIKGDQWVLTDVLPTKLFKYNGEKWIETDKNISDSYAYNQAYIERLIEKISAGQYDPELLTESERDQIESKLRNQIV